MDLVLEVEENGKKRTVSLLDAEVSIGRASENTVVVSDPRSSRRHCALRRTPQGFLLEDLKSRNGTVLNGATVTRSFVKEGDRFEIGKARFLIRAGREEGRAAPEAPGMAAPPAPAPSPFASTLAGSAAGGTVGAPGRDTRLRRAAETVADDGKAEPAGSEEAYLEGLEGVEAGRRFDIERTPFAIGRSSKCDLTLKDKRASSRHAQIVRSGSVFFVEDLSSTNGTFVEGRQVRRAVLLPGAILKIGDSTLRVSVPEPPPEEARSVRDEPAEPPGAEPPPAVSRFDMEKFLASRRSERPLAVVAVVVLLLVVCYGVVDVARRVARTEDPDPSPSGNLLGEVWSFEKAPREGGGAVPGWQLGDGSSGELRTTDERAQPPGRKALLLTSTQKTGLCLATRDEPVQVDPGAAYRLEGFVYNLGAFACGLTVEWLHLGVDRRVLVGRSYSESARQPGEAVDVAEVITAPAGANFARVSCFVFRSGAACFDRVSLHAGAGGSADAGAEGAGEEGETLLASDLTLRGGEPDDPVEVTLHPDGTASIARKRRPLISALWAGASPERDPMGFGPRLNPLRSGTPDGGDHLLVGEVPDIEAGRWVTLEMTAASTAESVVLRWRGALGGDGGEGVDPGAGASAGERGALCLYLEARADAAPLLADGLQLSWKPGAVPGGPFEELVLGEGQARLSLAFAAPVRLEAIPHPVHPDRGLLLARAAGEAEGAEESMEVALSHGSRFESKQAALAAARAEEAFRAGRLGEALSILAGLERDFPEQKAAVEDARRRVEEWKARLSDALEDLARQAVRLGDIRSPALYRSLEGRANDLVSRYRGSALEERARQAVAELEARWRSLEAEAGRGALEAALEKAERFYQRGLLSLAELYFRRVVEEAPEGEAAEAAGKRLRSIAGRKETEAKLRLQ
jgi:pSer/pThr/pTyr-binding forkhead associated (FHA) protein